MEGRRYRPVHLAREHGISTQAVRNYERDGLIPPAARTAAGHRVYSAVHLRALRAFLALVAAHGHATGAEVMRAAGRGDLDTALRAVDRSHAQLLRDRETLDAVEAAVEALGRGPAAGPSGRRSTAGFPNHRPVSPRPGGPPASRLPGGPPASRLPGGSRASGLPSGSPASRLPERPLSIGHLAHRLGVSPATLRKWERAGILLPRRDAGTGHRHYTAADVRDAELAHMLRRGGYPLGHIATVIDQVRGAGGHEPLVRSLDDWRRRLTGRGRAMLTAAAALAEYLGACEAPRPDGR
ncbi:MerR family transcriptional regulator [Streptomyces lavendulocolor]|uniref:MerR family transcriptional regulator n=1 Tax=Streptomyces lavendulocolor TaxID=67316 RepID=UPI003C2D2DE8